MKDKIICLVGESGSGKTTIAELLELEGYNYIESYTTRPPRFEGERGHIFVDDATAGKVKLEDIIAYTNFNGHEYWATKEQYQGKGTSIYVIDVPGIKKLKDRVKDAEIVVIHFRSDALARAERMYKRQGNYNGLYERLAHDMKAFEIIQSDYSIDANKSIGRVLELVKKVIGGLE